MFAAHPQPETIALLADALSVGEEARADLGQAAQRGRARSRTPTPDALASTHNLPLQLTSFVGRADDTEQIGRRIEESRLVTVVGSGGVGKTPIALEVAMHVAVNAREEVRLVDLAPLQDETLLTCRIPGAVGNRLSGSDDTPESLAKALNARRVLLVLDNCEHLIVGVTETARVLRPSGFLAKAQDAITEARRILAERRTVEPPSPESQRVSQGSHGSYGSDQGPIDVG